MCTRSRCPIKETPLRKLPSCNAKIHILSLSRIYRGDSSTFWFTNTMPLSDFIPRLAVPPPVRNTGFILSCSAATLTLIALARLSLQAPPPRTIRSPRATQLPSLSEAEQAALPYPPDAFPGARDVESPVGHVLHPPNFAATLTQSAVWDHPGL